MINMNMFFDFVITIKPMFTVKIFYIVPFKKKKVFIKPNMWHDEIFILLSKILNLPFDISKAIFAYIFVLNCIRLYKIPMCFLSWQLIFLIFEKKSRTMATLDK
jgi:hypothetical protein